MSQSPLNIAPTIEEILKEIKQELKETNKKIDTLSKEVNEFKLEVKTGLGDIKGDIKALDERINGFGKRLENQEFINRSIFLTLLAVVLSGVIKFLGWFPNS